MKHVSAMVLSALLVTGIAFGSSQSGTFSEEFQNVRELELDSLYVPVSIKAVSGPVLRFSAYDIPDSVEVIIEARGTTLSIQVRKKPFAILPPNPRSRITMEVPAAVDCKLSSASGSWEVEGMGGMSFSIDTASGDISCSKMYVPLKLVTSSGGITVQDSPGGKVLKSVSGGIMVRDSDGDLVIEAVSGRIRLQNVRGAVKAEGTSGSIDLERVQGRLYLSTVSGSINGNTIALEGEARIETTSGSIDLQVRNPASDFRYSASTVSGAIRIFSTRGSKNLEGGNGPIAIRLETVSGAIRLDN